MKKFIFASIIILCFSVFAFAQAEKTNCPRVYVNGPASISTDSTMDFSADVQGQSKDKHYRYTWSAVGGKIIAGQGTAKIRIEMSKFRNEPVKATVRVENLPENCRNEAFEMAILSHRKLEFPPLDEYGYSGGSYLKTEEAMARFDNLAIALLNNPNSNAYILFEVKKDEEISSVERYFVELSNLFKTRAYELNRITFDVCRSNKNQTTMWIIPPNLVKEIRPENCERINVSFK